jgi:hypothetical protein
MIVKSENTSDTAKLKQQLSKHWEDMNDSIGWLFSGLVIYIDPLSFHKKPLNRGDNRQKEGSNEPDSRDQIDSFSNIIRIAGGRVSNNLTDNTITHVVIGDTRPRARAIREAIKRYVSHHCLDCDSQEHQAESITTYCD